MSKQKSGKESHAKPGQKPWSGRFEEGTERRFEQFSASIAFDSRLYAEDIECSLAHAEALARAGVISGAERKKIAAGLAQIRDEIRGGKFEWQVSLEDVHMNIEARLVELVGETGKKLHTGRSRNDQVATDLRLYSRARSDALRSAIHGLQSGLVDVAEREAGTVMPAFTHLQAAQPVSFGHHMLAWFEMLQRDDLRLLDLRKRINVLPLGSAAGAGTSYPLDRQHVAELLGFESVSGNSLDAVSDRDFAIESCFACAMIMMHLSRMCEEIVLWCSPQFGFVGLPDRFCTGSSMMPQKKNPDAAELIRGKSGRVYGDLMSLLTVMKAQPLAYNRDNQEDKEALFDAFDTALDCVHIMHGVTASLTVNRRRLQDVLAHGFTTATDLADYLVAQGVPFRDAHRIVGEAVRLAVKKGGGLDGLSRREMEALHPALSGDEAAAVLSPEHSLQTKSTWGGTAPEQVRKQIGLAREHLAQAGGERERD